MKKTRPNFFCPTCGDQVLLDEAAIAATQLTFPGYPNCHACDVPYVKRNRYTIPLINQEGHVKHVVPELVVQETIAYDGGCYRILEDNEDAINVFVNGELNGIDTGKKIQEKNEQLKKKVAGYEHEQRDLRAEIEKQVADHHAQEGIKL